MEANERSPLVAVKQKELELAAELATAQQAAQREVEAARQWTTAYRRQAERDAREAAAVAYRSYLAAADAEAAAIRAEGQRTAARIAEQGAPAIEDAVQRILQIVVPSPIDQQRKETDGQVPTHKAQVSHA
jgi:vacuolar-type H+-ATPase subunit H